MTISTIVSNARSFSEKLTFTSKVKKENTINAQINENWAVDKDTIVNGYRNGPEATQHGVNAEYQHIAEFNVKEARLAEIENRKPIFMTKSNEVNGPHDMVRGNEVYQVKYYGNVKGSLNGCIKHLEKYEDMYGAGTDSFYVIPPEQYEDLLIVMDSKVPEGLSALEARNLQSKIREFEAKKGPIEDYIKPGAATYEEAQIENIEGNTLKVENEIKKSHEEKVEENNKILTPSFSKMLKQAGISALIAGMFSTYNRISEDMAKGKNIFVGEYDKNDYIDLAKVFIESSTSAAVSSCVLYGLTTAFSKMATPVSMFYRIAKDMNELFLSYKANKISADDFYEKACTNASIAILDTAAMSSLNIVMAVTISALVGEATIPALISMGLAMVVGMVANYLATMTVDYVKENFGPKIKEFISTVSLVNKSQKVNALKDKAEI